MSCAYRPSVQSYQQFENLDYNTLSGAPSDYWKTLANDWAYYNPTASLEPNPTIWYPQYKFARIGILGGYL